MAESLFRLIGKKYVRKAQPRTEKAAGKGKRSSCPSKEKNCPSNGQFYLKKCLFSGGRSFVLSIP